MTATDNCDTNVNVVFAEVKTAGACVDAYSLKRTWTATDACGNKTTATQTITVKDSKAPVIVGVPADATANCGVVSPVPTGITATDNCDKDVTITFAETTANGTCAGSKVITRTWTATDNCGNKTTATQKVSSADNEAPKLSAAPADANVECDAVPTAAVLTATDNCDKDVTIAYTEAKTDGNCPDAYSLKRTWVAIDDCGNKTTATQTITVKDSKAPVIVGVPADATANCGVVSPVPTGITATDNCDKDVTITFAETTANGTCAGSKVITRTWTATDNCGNKSTATQKVSSSDNEAPKLSAAPSDANVECDAVPAAATLTATDNCDTNVNVVFAEVKTAGACVDAYSLKRTWTATDACGNKTTATQTITVKDSKAPVIVGVPADATANCGVVSPVPTGITATDNCDKDVTITFAETTANGTCAGSKVITRTWTATDNCGNKTTATQKVSSSDNEAPKLSAAPSDANVECDAVPTAATLTATDNCDTNVNVVFAEVKTAGACVDAYSLKRTWTATDACGNKTTATQTITVKDSKAPVIVGVPADATANCGVVSPVPTGITATDNCDKDVTITFAETTANGTCAGSKVITRTWTATDNCGNKTTATQKVSSSDNEAPKLSAAPSDANVECDAVPAAATLTATDNCDTNVNVVFAEVKTAGACVDAYSLKRTWTATDACGNKTTATQTITVKDSKAPVIVGVPADATANCGVVSPVPTGITATDNCDKDVTITFAETTANGTCAGSKVITRTWTATDNCGNKTTATQKVSSADNEAPKLSAAPADANVECDAVPTAAVLTATDNCDKDVTIAYTEAKTDGNCPDAYSLKRTWVAIDDCGNKTTATQTITVKDSKAPVIVGVPADATANCGVVSPVPTGITATDNCDKDVTITFAETTANGTCAGSKVITRTWTATDNCGNKSTATQKVSSSDNEAPKLSAAPSDANVECDAVPAAATLTATDNCDTNVNVVFAEVKTAGACVDAYSLKRTWTATDACGNKTTATQTITVKDSKAPVIVGVPADATANCGVVSPVPTGITATDNCDKDVTITFAETTANGTCAGSKVITRDSD